MTNANWIKDAPCALPQLTDDSEEPRMVDFYSSNPEEKVRAKAVCAECPFKKQCIQQALDNKERWGIHGGADEMELRRAQAINSLGEAHVSQRGPIRCPLCGPYSTKHLKVIDGKRTRTHVECGKCGTNWWARKSINAKRTNW